jgi:hypothetical protein
MKPVGPRDPLSPVGVSDPFALWDAAYVLGSLSSGDRREFEAHLLTCPSCRQSVAELSGMPGLLAQLNLDGVAVCSSRKRLIAGAIDDGPSSAPPPMSPLLLTSLLAKVNRRRRRSRLATRSLIAAAAVLVTGVLVTVQSHPVAPIAVPPQANASALTMTPVEPTQLSSTVTISSHHWGTHIEMNCTYGAQPGGFEHDGDERGDKLAMVVIGRDGSHSRLATWVALTGVSATPGASVSMPIDHIAAVQIISADAESVLLQRSL